MSKETDVIENEDLETEFDTDLELDDDEDIEEVEDDEVEELDETAASDTLRPHGAPGETRAEMLSTFTSLLAQLGKEDLSKFFTMAQETFGPTKAPGAEDKSSTNASTIKAKSSAAKGSSAIPAMPMPKLGVKEDVEEMLGSEDLSEDFKERAETIFEAVLNTRVNLELVKLAEEYEELEAKLHEEYETKLEETTTEILESLTEKIDQYLDHSVMTWMEENKLAIENSLRTDIAENFIEGLQNLFAEHYILVPDERLDLVAEMKEELEQTQEELRKTLDEKLELQSIVTSASVDSIVDDLSEGLSETQIEKFKVLSEGIEFNDSDTYKKKLEIIKEQYFTKTKSEGTGILIESIDGSEIEDTKDSLYPGMSNYIKALSKN